MSCANPQPSFLAEKKEEVPQKGGSWGGKIKSTGFRVTKLCIALYQVRQFLGSNLGREVWRKSRGSKQHQVIKDKFCQADLIKTLDQITQVGDEVLALSRKGWNCVVMKGLVLQKLLAELWDEQGSSGKEGGTAICSTGRSIQGTGFV